MKFTLPTLALAALATAAPTSQAPDSFKIKNVISGGSGCPQGSIDINWTDQGILPITFSKAFTARVGATKAPDESRKSCQIGLTLDFSPGFSFAIVSADYTGFADLDTGVTAVVKSTYYFSGDQDQATSALSIAGPFAGRYYKQDSGLGVPVWSPCGEGKEVGVNVKTEVALTPFATQADGVVGVVREEVGVVEKLYVQWRKC